MLLLKLRTVGNLPVGKFEAAAVVFEAANPTVGVTSLDGTRSEESAPRYKRALGHSTAITALAGNNRDRPRMAHVD